MLYRAFVLPMFEYYDHIFDCLFDSHKVERLQNSSLRHIIGYSKVTSATLMRTELNQDSLALRTEYHTLNKMYKIVNNMSPDTICSPINLNVTTNSVTLRCHTRHDLVILHCKLECSQNNFVYRGCLSRTNYQ